GVALVSTAAPGTVRGVTGTAGDDAGPVPAALVAVTVTSYVVPLVSPPSSHVVAPVVVHVISGPDGGVAVTV
ncbi:MAG TPA: hypothetical protein PLV68_06340, partial [Ilumatobacteraceae bacterium]|nr:hypothetical protein [Ilumatobacteraceae bacterium]